MQKWRHKLQNGCVFRGGRAIFQGASGQFLPVRAAWDGQVDLLDPEAQRLHQARPERLRERLAAEPGRTTVVIDEVQKVPALLDVGAFARFLEAISFSPGSRLNLSEVARECQVSARDLHGLRAFQADYPEARVALLYLGAEVLRIDGILCLPCDSFLRRLTPTQSLL